MDRVKKTVHYWCADTIEGKQKGKGVTAAILDSGLAPHPDFRGRIRVFRDFVNQKKGLYDENGHGTHVAGILAGDGRMSKGILAGMASETELVILKVLNEKGEGSLEQMMEGIQWLKRNQKKYGIQIVNLSVGTRAGRNEKKEAMLVQMVEELWNAGMIVTASAGNFGPGDATITVPGTSRKVITVGMMERDERMKGCSGEGPTKECIVKPDVVAPGRGIISCNNVSAATKRIYTIKSGTSMATPVVSGAAALLASKYPGIRNVEVKLKLRESSEAMAEVKAFGWGKLRVDLLLKE